MSLSIDPARNGETGTIENENQNNKDYLIGQGQK